MLSDLANNQLLVASVGFPCYAIRPSQQPTACTAMINDPTALECNTFALNSADCIQTCPRICTDEGRHRYDTGGIRSTHRGEAKIRHRGGDTKYAQRGGIGTTRGIRSIRTEGRQRYDTEGIRSTHRGEAKIRHRGDTKYAQRGSIDTK